MALELQNRIYRTLNRYSLWRLEKSVIEINDVQELRRIFGWQNEPVIDDPSLADFECIEDSNQRRLRDAEVLGTICRNVNTSHCIEIGTASGHGTALMALNAPSATIHTVNILPEEVKEGGGYNTYMLAKEKIGEYYKSRQLKNVDQIFANTLNWNPNLRDVGVAFIDGCHDTKFVINDTKKVLKCLSPGSFILWHDFHPGLMRKYDWIYEVCLGVEKLLGQKAISGRILHVRNSWIGIYRVP